MISVFLPKFPGISRGCIMSYHDIGRIQEYINWGGFWMGKAVGRDLIDLMVREYTGEVSIPDIQKTS